MANSQHRESLALRNNQGKYSCGREPLVEEQTMVLFKKQTLGKYWYYASGVQPDNEKEIRWDVDQYVTTPSELTDIPVMSYEKALRHPVCKKKLVTVVNLMLLAYNYKDSRLYHDAGLAFGAQINYTLKPRDAEVAKAKLRQLQSLLSAFKFEQLYRWCLHEYPRTLAYLPQKGARFFMAGLKEAYERRWIYIPRIETVMYQVEPE